MHCADLKAHADSTAMFSPPRPTMREYCERDELGTGPVLDEDDGEEVRRRSRIVLYRYYVIR